MTDLVENAGLRQNKAPAQPHGGESSHSVVRSCFLNRLSGVCPICAARIAIRKICLRLFFRSLIQVVHWSALPSFNLQTTKIEHFAPTSFQDFAGIPIPCRSPCDCGLSRPPFSAVHWSIPLCFNNISWKLLSFCTFIIPWIFDLSIPFSKLFYGNFM